MALLTKSKLAKAISVSMPFIFGLGLFGCEDDNLNPSIINTNNSYEFSQHRSVNNPVNYLEATTALLLIDELDTLINSSYLQTFGQEHGYQATLALLNRVYKLGTSETEPDSLWNSNVYAIDSAESTPLNAVNLSNELLTYSQLAPNVSLQSLSPGFNQPLHNRYQPSSSVDENNTTGDVGYFVGWTILNIQDGDVAFDKVIQLWLAEIAKLASDQDSTTKFRNGPINYRALITTTLKTSIPYFQASHNSFNQKTIAELATDNPESLKSLWDLGFGYSGMATHANDKKFSSHTDQWANGAENLADLKQNNVSNTALFALLADEKSPYADIAYFNDLYTGFITGQSLLSIEQPNLNDKEIQSHLYSTSSKILDTWEKALLAKLIGHLNDTVDEANIVHITKIAHTEYIDAWSNLKACAIALQFNPNSPLGITGLADIHRHIGNAPAGANAVREFQASLVSDRLDDPALRNVLQYIYDFSTIDTQSW